jgi:hypothetical protein
MSGVDLNARRLQQRALHPVVSLFHGAFTRSVNIKDRLTGRCKLSDFFVDVRVSISFVCETYEL